MKLPVPEKVLDQHCILLGKTRAGKSSTLRVLVEHLLDHEKPVCIIDPKGDWWGLKSSADGKSAGYPVIIFGGPHADVPITAHSGAHVAELISTGNRPCIIDLKGWMPGERTKFFVDFASTMFRTAQGLRWLVIDEVHNFAPQGKVLDPEAGKMLHWANRLISEGSGMGITLLSASQRPQKVHKDFVTSNETLFALRVIHKLDRDADKDWIDGCADPQAGKDVLASLAGLKRGEAWVWSPEIEFGPKRVQFPLFRTYDSFKPQAAGHVKLKGWAEIDMDDVRAKFSAVIDEAKASDPKALKAEIGRLKAEIGKLSSGAPAYAAAPKFDPESPVALKDRERAWAGGQKQGHDLGFAAGWQAGHEKGFASGVEMAITCAVVAFSEGIKEVRNEISTLTIRYSPSVAPRPPKILPPPPAPPTPEEIKADVDRVRALRSEAPKTFTPRPVGQPSGVRDRVLGALAELEAIGISPAPRIQAAFLARYKHDGVPNFRNTAGALRTDGLITYPTSDTMQLTDSGRAVAPPVETVLTSEALHERIISLLDGVHARILPHLIGAYPDAMARDDLAKLAGYLHAGVPNFRNSLGRLRSLGFVQYPDSKSVVATPTLFIR